MSAQAEVFALISVLLEADEKIPEGQLTYTRAVAKMLILMNVPDSGFGRRCWSPEQCLAAATIGLNLEAVRNRVIKQTEADKEAVG